VRYAIRHTLYAIRSSSSSQKQTKDPMIRSPIPKIIIAFILLSSNSVYSDDVKRSDLAGSWYTDSAPELKAELESYLNKAEGTKLTGEAFAIISPHAGYRFSGSVAAYGYKAIQGKPFKTVILLGFCHRKQFDGIAIYDRGAFETPLGSVVVDRELAAMMTAKSGRVRYIPEAFSGENSVEMEIPFIQMALPGAKIVPVAFGTQSFDDAKLVGDILGDVLKGRDDVIVIASTDLSHYHPYAEANSIDDHTINTIKTLDGRELFSEAGMGVSELCGVMPVTAVMIAAKKLGYERMDVLKYANSGDTYGDKSKVVGYLSAVIYKDDGGSKRAAEQPKDGPMLNKTQRSRLLAIARESITSFVRDGKRKSFLEEDPVLKEELGAFVTLHEYGELRGCIGNMTADGPLYKTVSRMAVEAATGDPRFPSLGADEISRIDIEISVLSPLKKVASYKDVKIPGDGVIVSSGFRRGVYLPQVATETGWDRDEFLTSLCAHKAGLKPDAWKDPATEIYVFTAEVFGEKSEARQK